MSYSLAKESKADGGGALTERGVGGSGEVLNQSFKIWLGPITMVRSQQSHTPTKFY
jgi:hypothetical protein